MTDDDDRTQPGVRGDPGNGAHDAFADVIGALGGAVRALDSAKEVVEGLAGESRRRCLWAMVLAAGELGDAAHEFRRVVTAILREEQP